MKCKRLVAAGVWLLGLLGVTTVWCVPEAAAKNIVIRYDPQYFGTSRFGFGVHALSSDWGDSRHQFAAIYQWDMHRKNWWIGPAADIMGAYEDGKMSGVFGEFDVGLRVIMERRSGRLKYTYPYIGGGFATGYASVEDSGRSDRGWSTGWWSQLGVTFRVDRKLGFTLEGRYSYLPVDLGNVRAELEDANMGGAWVFGSVALRW